MADLEQFKTVDLIVDHANSNTFIPKQYASAGDIAGRTTTLQVTDDGVVNELPGIGATAAWYNKASGQTGLDAFEILDKSKNILVWTYPQSMLTAGTVEVVISIQYQGKSTDLRKFTIEVQQVNGQMAGIVSSETYKALTSALARVNKYDTSIAQLQAYKADRDEVNQAISNVTSGTPKESFEFLSALQTKYPKGKEGTFLVKNDDGTYHTYMYQSGSWKDLGVYQATGIANNSIKRESLEEPTQNIAYSSRVIHAGELIINTAEKSILVNFNSAIVINGFKTYNYSKDSFKTTFTQTGVYIYFDTSDSSITFKNSPVAGLTQKPLGYVELSQKIYDLNAFTRVVIDNVIVRGAIETNINDVLFAQRQLALAESSEMRIDTAAKTLTYPSFHIVSDGVNNFSLASKTVNYSGTGLFFYLNTNGEWILRQKLAYFVTEKYIGYIELGGKRTDLPFDVVVDGEYINSKKPNIKNKLVAIGDSITWGDNGISSGGNSISWVAYMQRLCSFSAVENKGKPGWQVSDGFLNLSQNTKDVDGVITFFGGVNDFHKSADLTKFEQQYSQCLEVLQSQNPKSKILVITPMKCNKSADLGQFIPTYDKNFNLNKNSLGNTQEDYVDVAKKIAGRYSIPVLDMYNISNLNPFVSSHFTSFFGDGLHPNSEGYKRMSKVIASKINSL